MAAMARLEKLAKEFRRSLYEYRLVMVIKNVARYYHVADKTATGPGFLTTPVGGSLGADKVG